MHNITRSTDYLLVDLTTGTILNANTVVALRIPTADTDDYELWRNAEYCHLDLYVRHHPHCCHGTHEIGEAKS